MDDLEEESIALLIDAIDKYLETHPSYTFRPVRVDNIYCYAIIHKSPKVVYFESINVRCKISADESEKYILYYKYYDQLRDAVNIVRQVVATYKLYNGDLVHPDNYALMRLEEYIIPYEPDQQCCVCREPTQEQTLCNHYLCFHCRDTCLTKQQLNCPVCRQENVVKYFHIDNHLLNNVEYDIIRQIRPQNNTVYEEMEESEMTDELTTESAHLYDIDHRITQSIDEYDHIPVYYHQAPFMFFWNFRRNYI